MSELTRYYIIASFVKTEDNWNVAYVRPALNSIVLSLNVVFIL